MSDEELIRASFKDGSAYGELYERYFEETLDFLTSRFFYRTSLKREDAKDISQVAFAKAYNKLGSFRFNSKFKTWVFSIARNSAIDFLRSKENKIHFEELSFLDEDGEESVAEIMDENMLPPDKEISLKEETDSILSSVNKTKESLSDSQKRIFDLIFVDEKKYKEASQILGCPIGTVMSRVLSTRKKFAKLKS